MKRITVYKETHDDWHPSYTVHGWDDLKLVTVSFTQTGPNPDVGDGEWRVCVWGEDDCGMERDYSDKSLALAMFNKVIQWEFVDMSDLKKHGFVSA